MNLMRISSIVADGLVTHGRNSCSGAISQFHTSCSVLKSDGNTLMNKLPPLGDKGISAGIHVLNVPQMPEKPFDKFISENNKAMPHATLEERIDLLRQKWSNLSEMEKMKYQENYKKERADYYASYKNFLQNLSPADLKEVNSNIEKQKSVLENKFAKVIRKLECARLGKPKKPHPAVFRFYAAVKLEREGPNKISILSNEWRNMPESERKVYLMEYEEDIAVYHENLNIWEEKMLAIGRPDLLRRTSKKSLDSSKKSEKLSVK